MGSGVNFNSFLSRRGYTLDSFLDLNGLDTYEKIVEHCKLFQIRPPKKSDAIIAALSSLSKAPTAETRNEKIKSSLKSEGVAPVEGDEKPAAVEQPAPVEKKPKPKKPLTRRRSSTQKK